MDINTDPDEALKGLSRLVHRQKGVRALLFHPEALATGERRKTSRIQFRARVAYHAGDSEYLWTGLAFQGNTIATLWNELVRQGWVELPGRAVAGIPTALPEAHQFFRNFLGLKADDWAAVLVCGNPKECTGILVVISPHSRMADLPATFPHLFKQGTKRIA